MYLIPVVLVVAPGINDVLVQDVRYLTVITIHIRSNLLVNDLAIDQQLRGAEARIDPSELMANEFNNLIWTESFMRETLELIEIDDPKYQLRTTSRAQLINDLQRGMRAWASGTNQVALVVYAETDELATAIANGAFEQFLQRKITQNMTESDQTQPAIDNLLVQYAAQVSAIENELEQYLISHPLPDSFLIQRPDIEKEQILRLREALAMADRQYEQALSIKEDTDLFATTTEEGTRQTYLVLDAPTNPVRLTSRAASITQLISRVVIGVILSVMILMGIIIFDQRLTLPMDVVNTSRLPVIAVVELDDPEGLQKAWWHRLILWPFRRWKARKNKKNDENIGNDNAGSTAVA